MPGVHLRSSEFRREREAQWRSLQDLVERVETRGSRALDAGELTKLPLLYRATLSSLSVARSISLDRNLLQFLEGLTARAYFVVYGTRRRLREPVTDFVLRRFPSAARRFRRHTGVAAALLLCGVLAGWALTRHDLDRFYSFVPGGPSAGHDPTCPTDSLRANLYAGSEAQSAVLGSFASYLFAHNARIAMLSFALGFAAGVPVFWLLFTNGLMLGALAALYQGRGLGVDFWSWVLPHGITELLAVVLCGGAGLALGQSLVFPGRFARLTNLARCGREAGLLVIGAVILLAIAGLLEGFFRQRVQSVPVRFAVAVASAGLWMLYFGLLPRRPRAVDSVHSP